jgi:hypothetical protein
MGASSLVTLTEVNDVERPRQRDVGGVRAIVSEDEALAHLGVERQVVRGDAVTFARGADGTVTIILRPVIGR